MIIFDSVTKAFSRAPVLRGFTLSVRAGELVGVIGKNGAGKSTALKVLTGQLVPDSGHVSLGGYDVHRDPERARAVLGYVPQDGELEPFLTGEEVLEYVAAVRGVPSPGPRIDALLTGFEIAGARRRLTREYSEGMARRLSLAAALIGEPPVLVLDEPLNGLDPRGVRLVRDTLIERQRAGTAVLVTGHFLETLERICSRVVLVNDGVIARDLDRAALDELSAAGRSLEDLFLEVVS